MKQNIHFNTQHSPIGAFASFTLGAKGAKGGLGLELGKPADQNVFIGLADGESITCLPFFQETADDSARFDVEAGAVQKRVVPRSWPDKAIRREFSAGSDTWTAGDLTFAIHTPAMAAPEPGKVSDKDLRLAYVPALTVELTVDNTRSKKDRLAIFGFQGNDPVRGMRLVEGLEKITGIACGDTLAIASDSPGVHSALGFSVEDILGESDPFNHSFGIGGVGLLVCRAKAGKKQTFRFAVCFHRAGQATTGLNTRYHYTRYFSDIEAVAAYALENFGALKKRGDAFDKKLAKAKLGEARSFMLAQAVHSYYGSTQFLEFEGKPLWAVNEGEYRMLNTLDLTIDQLFFEMEMNPWTVRNELDWFLRRYSYTDTVRFPGDATEYPGGITFTHDMGITNHFSPPQRSVYEKSGLHGCFSHMSHEELVNWLVCALVYVKQSGDTAWRKKNLPTFQKILTSLLNRDHPDPAQRDGVMSLDSSRCAGGSEITTYDSLDVSLGQARNNLYLAVKCWGSYVGLADLFSAIGDKKRAATALDQARRAAATISATADKNGLLPAILHENVESRIIPAIEGLVIPHALGLKKALSPDGEFGPLIASLRRHLRGVLKQGICLFPDGGWKISSTSNNSWLSKVYLCQFIASEILGEKPGKAGVVADQAHAAWLLDEKNNYWAWSDQIVSGEAKGSKYYPRGVTSILWLKEKQRA
ncbi:MAG: glycoside hydrolase family 52 protein [Verrucomicrobia bacterium]|nr:glycoside hydrolase family 52 protein [Verrucomicrobiota bacterium]